MICPECKLETPILIGETQVDACFGGKIQGCISACCGHGGKGRAYVRLRVETPDGDIDHIDICAGVLMPYAKYYPPIE